MRSFQVVEQMEVFVNSDPLINRFESLAEFDPRSALQSNLLRHLVTDAELRPLEMVEQFVLQLVSPYPLVDVLVCSPE